jgi:hypothetical protein
MSAVVGTTAAAGIVGLSVFSNYITAPTQIPGLLGWYDGKDPLGTGVTPSNGFNISNWIDKSGRSNNASNIGGSIPSYSNNAVYFNGVTSNKLFFTNPNELVANKGFSIFVVEKRQGAATSSYFLAGTTATNYQNLHMGYRYGNTFAVAFYGNDQDIIVPNYTTATTEPYRIWTTTLNNSFLGVTYLNGTTQGSYQHGGLVTSYTGGGIGGTPTFSPPGWYTGFIQEILFYSNVVTATQQQQVEGYLAWKWGLNSNLPVSHFQLNSNVTGLSATVPTGNATAYNAPFSNFITAPTQVPGLQLWLDASSSNNFTLSNTSNVVQWNDKSANSNNFQRVQGTPTLISPIQGVFFSSTRTDLMRSFSSNISYTANITNLFVVAMYSNPGNYAYIINFGCNTDVSLRYNGGAGANPNDFYFNYTLSQQIFNVNGTFTNGFTPSGNTINIYNIFSGVYGPSAGGTSSPSFIQLSSAFNGRYLNGFINEVLMYSNALTANQRTQVEGYLAWKWGLNSNLPVSHYQKNSNTTGIAAPIPTTAPGFVPSSFLPSVYSNLALWLDAADATTIQYSSGANISNWRDKSGNGRNAIQAISIQQPIYTNKGVNFIRANNTNLVTTYTAQPIIEYLFIVINYTNPGGNAENIIRGNGVQSRQIFLNSSTNCILGVESLTSYTSATLSQNQIILLETIYNSNTSNAQINVNGSIIATANTGIVGSNPFNTGAGNTTIGYNTNSMDSTVYEVIVYSNVLTSQQRQNVEGYLAWKWGLTPSLPSTHQNAYIPP